MFYAELVGFVTVARAITFLQQVHLVLDFHDIHFRSRVDFLLFNL